MGYIFPGLWGRIWPCFKRTCLSWFNEDLTLLVLLGRDSPGLMRMRLPWFYEDTTLLVL